MERRVVSRRQFLQASLGLIVPTAEVALLSRPITQSPVHPRVVLPIAEQIDSWNMGSLSNDAFVTHFEEKLKQIRIGSSFSLEQYEYLKRKKHPGFKHDLDGAAKALGVILDNWGVRDVRLGLRRNQITQDDGKINLLLSHPFIVTCLERGANIMVGIGPVKVFRDPEEHIPFRETIKPGFLPANGSVVELDSPFGQFCLDRADNILGQLKTDYPGAKFDIQPENEPKNSCGRRRYTFEDAYLEELIKKIDKHYPTSKILLNSTGGLAIPNISEIFKRLLPKNPDLRGRLVSGIDFYYLVPEYYSEELNQKFDFSLIPGVGNLDGISLSHLLYGEDVFFNDYMDALEFGYQREVTENQLEAWGYHRTPGKSAREYRFTLARCIDNIFFLKDRPAQSELKIIRDWGDEALVMDQMNMSLTTGQVEIIELKRYINNQRVTA